MSIVLVVIASFISGIIFLFSSVERERGVTISALAVFLTSLGWIIAANRQPYEVEKEYSLPIYTVETAEGKTQFSVLDNELLPISKYSINHVDETKYELHVKEFETEYLGLDFSPLRNSYSIKEKESESN